jgi:ABC-2 type transport system permease protein
MTALLVATEVELFKLRRTLALLAALVVPLAILIMVGAITLSRDPGALPGDPWDALVVNFTYFLWCVLALPMLVTLEVSLLAGLEHGQHHWKDLFALPVPRWSLYAAKLLTGALLVALSLLVLALGLGIEGLLLNTLRPSLGLTPPVPWLDIFGGVAKMFSASLLLLALITWVAMRWSSFAVPCAVGITGTVVGLTLDISARSDFWASLFPWSMPLSAVARIDQYRTLEDHVTAIALGVIGGLIISALGAWDITRRDVV